MDDVWGEGGGWGGGGWGGANLVPCCLNKRCH